MISIKQFFAVTGFSILISILSFTILTEGIRPENGATDPLSHALVFSASLAFIVLNILIIALAAMKVSIPEKDQK